MRSSRCPLLAQSRHELVHCTCPLSREKRTLIDLRPDPGIDRIRALRAALKILLRHFSGCEWSRSSRFEITSRGKFKAQVVDQRALLPPASRLKAARAGAGRSPPGLRPLLPVALPHQGD